MPSSEPGIEAGWGRWLVVAWGLGLICLAGVAARVSWFDAYWLFRETPPWIAATDGANRLLDRQTRRAKMLQAMTRSYDVALIGSSTVYHGLDPRDVAPAFRHRTFNLGISALMADELPVVAAVVAARPHVARVTIGLDYYMFSRRNAPVRVNAALSEPIGRANTLMGSLVSHYALFDSALAQVEGGDDPGAWTRDGFRITPPLTADLTRESDAIRRRTAAPYRRETLGDLDAALQRLSTLQVVAYLSPVSTAQRRVLADAGLLDDFARWRRDVADLAHVRGIAFVDLADLGLASPFDASGGSTDVWLDNLHFTPVLGRTVMGAIGLRTDGAAGAPGDAR